jgi:hypothetical protein
VRAPAADYCASVSVSVRCVSMIERRTRLSVSAGCAGKDAQLCAATRSTRPGRDKPTFAAGHEICPPLEFPDDAFDQRRFLNVTQGRKLFAPSSGRKVVALLGRC